MTAKPSIAPSRGGWTVSSGNRLPGWSGHIASWLDQTDIPVHLVRYEDLKADTVGYLSRAHWLLPAARATDEEIHARGGVCRFRRIAAAGTGQGIPRGAAAGRAGYSSAAARPATWRDELTPEQVARIEAAHAPMMRRLGYELASAMPLARTA